MLFQPDCDLLFQYFSYRTRKQLQREDAVQITTSTASASTETLNELTPRLGYTSQHNTGEFHDTIVLSIHPH